MATDRPPGPTETGSGDWGEDRLAEVLGRYVDRLLAGEEIDCQEIQRDHPDLAPEIIREIETLQGLGSRGGAESLGSLGDYQLLRQVGRGGMGVVYEAHERSMDRRVALKVLPEEFLSEARAVARFVKEARIAGKLQHPAIVSIHGMGIDKGRPFYAMEFVEGSTLAQLLKDHRCGSTEDARRDRTQSMISLSPLLEGGEGEEAPGSWSRVDDPSDAAGVPVSPGGAQDMSEVDLTYCLRMARAFARLAEGLHHAHQRGVIHRDLKPSNIILDRAGRLRILDFGLARLEGDASLTRSRDLLGTPLYMSPEQINARVVTVDHRTDIYSLGATLYEMLSFEPPISGKDHQDTLSRILFQEPRPLRVLNPRIPRDLETILEKCLAKAPEARYRTAEALAQDLRRFTRGDPIEARPQAAWEKVARRAWRKKGTIAAVTVCLLLLLTTGLLILKHQEGDLRVRESKYRRAVLDALALIDYGQTRLGGSQKPSASVRAPGSLRLLPEAIALEEDSDPGPGPNPLAEALALLEDAARLLPGRPEALYHRARALGLQGREEEAVELVNLLLERRSPFAPARMWNRARLESQGVTPSAQAAEGAKNWEAHYRLAQRETQSRRWAEAVRAFTALIEALTPGEEPYLGALLEARLGRGRARLRLKIFEEALEDFSAAEALVPRSLEPRLLVARTYYRMGRQSIVDDRLRALFEFTPFKDLAAQKISGLHYEFTEYEKALDWAERIQDGAIRDSERAQCLVRLGRGEEALKAAERAVGLEPADYRARHVRGYVLAKEGKLDDAAKELRTAIELQPKSSRSQTELSSVLERMGRFEEAIQAARRGIEIDPGDPGAHNVLGFVYLQMEDRLDEAQRCFEKSLEIDPEGTGALNILGLVLLHRGKLDEAIGAFEQVIVLDPKLPPPYSNLGWAHSLKGNQAKGIELCSRSLSLDPKADRTLIVRGVCFVKSGDYEKGLADFEKVVQINPWNAWGHFNQGRTLERLRRPEEAILAYRKAIAVDPHNVRFPYNLGNALSGLGRLEEALLAYQEALKIVPDHDYSHHNLGETLYQLGRLSEARQHFEETLRINPESTETHLCLGLVLEKQGHLDEAIEAARMEMLLSPKDPRPLDRIAEWLEEKGDLPRALSARDRGISLHEEAWISKPADREAAEGLVSALEGLARLSLRSGDHELTRDCTVRALDILRERTELPGVSAGEMAAFARAILTAVPEDLQDPRAALEYAEQAAILSSDADPEILDVLAQACFWTGNVGRALETERKALLLLEDNSGIDDRTSTLRTAIQDHLKHFQAAAPSRSAGN